MATMTDNRHGLATATLATMVGLVALAIPGCEQAEGETIGPRGGTVISDDGRFSIEIPEGALEEEIEVTLERVPCGPEDALAGCYEAGPVGLPLLFPAEVVYEVDEHMMETFGPDDLAVVVENEDAWNVLADRRVNLDDITVSASAVYLSSFALVAIESSATE
jgi:hypothetical protein